MELSGSKYYQLRDRYGKVNEHNVLIPRDHGLEQWERMPSSTSTIKFPLEGYRRLIRQLPDLIATS
jgi:putative transposase